MNRDNKRISPNFSAQIGICIGHILNSKGFFDGDGYPFKKAISKLRKNGHIIKYYKEKGMYKLIKEESK